MLKRIAFVLGVLGCVAGAIVLAVGQEQRASPSKPLVLSHVTVIDVAAGRINPEMTVIISGDRIEAVGASGKVSTPGNALFVDAKGKFLIPLDIGTAFLIAGSGIDVSPDGRWLVYTRADSVQSDIMMVENFR